MSNTKFRLLAGIVLAIVMLGIYVYFANNDGNKPSQPSSDGVVLR
jgi:hypothetical protein